MFGRIVNIVCAAFLLLWFAPKFVLTKVDPWEIGVRQSVFGGVAEEDFGLGYHFAVTGVHRFHRLPATVRFLDFNNEGDAEASSLEVRTKENNIIFVDVTVPWRIKRGEAWRIVREGLVDYEAKVVSTATGMLREGLAVMSNSDVQIADERQRAADEILPKLNEALARYHVEATGVLIRAIQFRPEYESKLQNKQYFVVQGRLDEAKRQESVAITETDTLEQTIQKDINLKREEWNAKIEALKTEYEVQIAKVEAEAIGYDRKRRSEADALYATAKAKGDLAEAKAEALGEKLKAEALASRAGRTYSGILAAENFEIGDIELNSLDPNFLSHFGSMKAWRNFFLGE
jgi:regulator of protease activity HflC (stomatin/prohibitin superfamily)